MGFWFILSGFFDLTHTLMGIFSVALVLWVNYGLRKHNFFEDEEDVLHEIKIYKLPAYFIWLIWQIIVSGFQVARILISPKLPIDPHMIKFKVNFPNVHAKMILGNSITLTPGTLTVDIVDDEFTVHALSPVSFEGITSDAMPQKVLRLFTSDVHPVVSEFRIIQTKEEI